MDADRRVGWVVGEERSAMMVSEIPKRAGLYLRMAVRAQEDALGHLLTRGGY